MIFLRTQRLEQSLRSTLRIFHLKKYHRFLQELDLDSINIISSYRGFGKSNLSLLQVFDYLSRYGFKCPACGYTWVYTGKQKNISPDPENRIYGYCGNCGDAVPLGISWKRFDMKDVWKYIAYSDDIFEKIKDLETYSPLVADEGVNFAMGEDWMNSGNKQIKKLFAQCRTKHMTMFINIPKFKWIQSKYRDDMATGWFRIIKRGYSIFCIPDIGEGDDAWHLKEFQDILGSYNYMTSKTILAQKIQKLRARHPCFYDAFHIPKVPDSLYKTYLKIRDYYVYRRGDVEDVSSSQMGKVMLYNLKANWKQLQDETKGKPSITSRILSNSVLKHPIKQTPLLSEQTVRNYVSEIRKWVTEKAIEKDKMKTA